MYNTNNISNLTLMELNIKIEQQKAQAQYLAQVPLQASQLSSYLGHDRISSTNYFILIIIRFVLPKI